MLKRECKKGTPGKHTKGKHTLKMSKNGIKIYGNLEMLSKSIKHPESDYLIPSLYGILFRIHLV